MFKAQMKKTLFYFSNTFLFTKNVDIQFQLKEPSFFDVLTVQWLRK